MPNPKTVSLREFNKQVKLIAELNAALEAAQDNIERAKKKSQGLRKQLKEVRARQSQELASLRNKCEIESQQQVQELRNIQDKTKRENEQLRLLLQERGVKIPGNLANFAEHFPDKTFLRRVDGGDGGAI